MATHNDLGRQGEEKARQYLIENGYTIREINWRYQQCELDIIAEKDSLLIAVEVKTRSSDTLELPEEAVGDNKKQRMVKAINHYIALHALDFGVRFDIISIVVEVDNQFKIKHITDAFKPYELVSNIHGTGYFKRHCRRY